VADHVTIGILLGLASGIVALLVIAVATLRRFDSVRHTESIRLHRALGDLQRTTRHELAALRRDVQAAAAAQERLAAAAADRLAQLTEGAVTALREHPLPALGELAAAQEQRLSALAGELTRLSEAMAADAAGHAKDLRNELLESLRVTLDEFRAAHAIQVAQVRASIDEKLERTVEARLGDSFRLVSERLELVNDRLEHVHRGLGEVQAFAAGLGHLQRAVATVRLGGNKTAAARSGEASGRGRVSRRKPAAAAPEAPVAVEAPQTSAS
jgi:DNA recombination protein RmuC